ncbi:hypothetical protein Arth_3045 [Arthrobacter sp. FB24]|jgi:hypothetical protein|uniref:hypothetical protein n=1 Tax=Arthrobacter sp. (strain FB24) TaxID=290399 RepID=UPI00005266E8|nr:hypothetical protein [Arthrobacter sp. FB24]ABK04424.1 hypothetical protein Arth_3045 [Arthrobacter sp. FB24]
MDQIKNMISATDPVRNDPSTPDGEAALRRMLSEPAAFSDRLPAGATSLEERRLRRARLAGVITLAAAAVTAGVLAATNLGPLASAPGPATTVTGSISPAPTTTAPRTTAPPTTAPPLAASVQTFVFPDGHLSFAYPEGWSVRTEQGPYLSEEAKAGSVVAVVADDSGSEVARVLSGMYGDGAAGSVKRTVLDHTPVPGITDASGNPAEFGFAADQILPVSYPGMPAPTEPADGTALYYFMDVRLAQEFLPTQATSGTNQIRLPNGVMSAYAVFDLEKQPAFATPDAARDWMASERYAQLKALLLSLRYS